MIFIGQLCNIGPNIKSFTTEEVIFGPHKVLGGALEGYFYSTYVRCTYICSVLHVYTP